MDEQSIIDEWKKDSQSFDTVASLYDEFRPEYPPELVEAVISLSGIMDGGRILEIGSGTGKATRLFARRGYLIHCIEPGRNLAAVAARNLKDFPGVTFEITRFEESRDLCSEFDLVMSAQAFHWVPKEIGYAKAARALKPAGPWRSSGTCIRGSMDRLTPIWIESTMRLHPDWTIPGLTAKRSSRNASRISTQAAASVRSR